MRKYKKNVAVILMVLLVIIIFSETQITVNAASKSDFDMVSKAYSSYVKRKLSSYEKYPRGSYMLYDINNDGIYEMFFQFETGVRLGYKVYTFKNNKVVKLKSFAGCNGINYNKSKKQICVLESSSVYDNIFTYYTMKNNKLKKIAKYESIWDYSSETLKIDYYKNGKKISEKAFNKQMETFFQWDSIQNFEYDKNIVCDLTS